MKIIPLSSRVFLFCLAGVIFFGYSFALSNSFKTDDDRIVIVANQALRDASGLEAIVTGSISGDRAYYRPMVSLSHFAEYQLFGLNALFYYLTNILLHAANAFSVFFLLKKFIQQQSLVQLMAFFYAIHPIHWAAVSNVAGRPILLSAFFVLAAFNLAFSPRQSLNILSLACFAFALLSKESAVMFPFVFAVFLFFQTGETKLSTLKRTSGYLAVLALYFVLRGALAMTNVAHWRNAQEFILGTATFIKSVLLYLRLLVLPLDLHFDRSVAVLNTYQWPLAVILFAVAIVFLAAVIRLRRQLTGTEKFFIVWFFLELVPVSSVLVLIGVQPGFVLAGEQFLYVASIPALGLFVLLAKRFGAYLTRKNVLSPRAGYFVIIALGFFYSVTLITMAMHARSETLMYKRTLHFAPHNLRVRRALGVQLVLQEKLEEAGRHFKITCRANPLDAFSCISLGKTLADQGLYEEALGEYKRVKNPGNYRELLAHNIAAVEQILEKRKMKEGR